MCTEKVMHLLILTFYKQVENTFLTKIPTAPLCAFNQLSNYLQFAQHFSYLIHRDRYVNPGENAGPLLGCPVGPVSAKRTGSGAEWVQSLFT